MKYDKMQQSKFSLPVTATDTTSSLTVMRLTRPSALNVGVFLSLGSHEMFFIVIFVGPGQGHLGNSKINVATHSRSGSVVAIKRFHLDLADSEFDSIQVAHRFTVLVIIIIIIIFFAMTMMTLM